MSLIFSYENSCGISTSLLQRDFEQLMPHVALIRRALDAGYDSAYASINLPADERMHAEINALVVEKKKLRLKALVLIGIGGSNMGCKAVHEALLGTLYNAQQPDCALYYADTVDADYTAALMCILERILQRGDAVMLTIISKSGATLETMANAELFLALLKQYKKEAYADYVVMITDEDSSLWRCAVDASYARLAIPAAVGGRYSVFSAVGLFPLGMLGVDTQQLVRGARRAIEIGLSHQFEENSAAMSALIRAHHYRADIAINDTFIFDVSCVSIGSWYRQLIGESIGKEYNTMGQRVAVGITPTVSVGTIDLHSVAQLYLGGPRDKYTTFLSIDRVHAACSVPHNLALRGCADVVAGHSFAALMRSIMQGVAAAYAHDERPYTMIQMPAKTPFYLGQLLQWYMIEMMLLGFLLEVNPFDQPNVQAYKKEAIHMLQGQG